MILVKAGSMQMGTESSVGWFPKKRSRLFLRTDPNTDVKREGKKGITEWYQRSPTQMNGVAESGKECRRLAHIKDGQWRTQHEVVACGGVLK